MSTWAIETRLHASRASHCPAFSLQQQLLVEILSMHALNLKAASLAPSKFFIRSSVDATACDLLVSCVLLVCSMRLVCAGAAQC